MQLRPVLLVSICLLLAVAASVSPVWAQTAQLSGLVKDASEAVIPNADITIVNEGTGVRRTATSNAQGYYVVPFLQPGTYRISVQAGGFQLANQPGVTLTVGQQARIDFVLQVGTVAQTITVEGGAPLLNTESPAVSTVVDRQFVANLPLNGRSFHTLIELTPGVVPAVGDGAGGQFSVNGQRANSNAFIIDGVSANIGIGFSGLGSAGGTGPAYSGQGGTSNLVSIDALEEFRIQTSTFSAEFGRQPGAQVSVVTRSGTNQFHGTLFNYFRNDKLDANDWFVNSFDLDKPALRQNDFGGVIGGPIVKDRTFFFFSHESLRLRLPQTFSTLYVPTEAARQLAPPETKPILDAFPLPNGPELADTFPPFTSMLAEFNSALSIPSTLDATSLKLDQSWGNLRLFGRYNHAPSKSEFRFVPQTATQVKSTTQTLTAGATWAFTPNVVNELRGNWSRNRINNDIRLNEIGGNVIPPDSALFPSFSSSQEGKITISIQAFTPTGSPSFTVGNVTINRQRQFNFVDTLSIVKGSHQLKFGVDYQRLTPILAPRSWNGSAVFVGVQGVIDGIATRFTVTSRSSKLTHLFNNLSLFAQDTWKAAPRLTLTYGLRWEYAPPPSEKEGRLPFTVIGVDDPATMTLAPQGTPLYKATTDNFAPRIGAAYHLSQKWGLVLRGGFGLYYDLGNGQALVGAGFWPYISSNVVVDVPWPPDDATATPPPFSLDPDPPFSTLSVSDPNLKLPRSYQWNLALEKSLGPDQTISATYVGNVGRGLLRKECVEDCSSGLGLINPDFTRIFLTENASNSEYKSLQLQFQRRFSRGLQALVNYSWSRAIDEASTEFPAFLPDEDFDLVGSPERGRADFDATHNFTASVSYDIPTPPGSNDFVKAAIGDWSVDSIIRVRSGAPITVSAAAFIDGIWYTVRPDQVPGEPFWIKDPSVPAGTRINPDAFDANAPWLESRPGNMPRNGVPGLGLSQVDFSLRRRFTLTERSSLQFRVDFFNLFNHPNFANPDPFRLPDDFGGGFFGDEVFQMLGRSLGGFNPLYQIGGPRSIQFALKVLF